MSRILDLLRGRPSNTPTPQRIFKALTAVVFFVVAVAIVIGRIFFGFGH